MTRAGALLLLAAALAPTRATGEADPLDRWATPRYGAFELSLGGYRPKIDSEFSGGSGPYQATFGGGRGLMFRADVAYSVLVDEVGSLDIGGGAGYFERYGKGQFPDGGISGDSTALKVIPSRVSLTYRLEWFWNAFGVPLALRRRRGRRS